MPTIHVDIPVFDKYLGEKLSFKQLEDLSFEFGIEIEEKEKVLEEKEQKDKKKQKKQFEYAFEIAANRPDLLSVEGLCIALACYRKTRQIPEYKITKVDEQQQYSLEIEESCNQIRPHVVAAILRNLDFNQVAYNSFIDFQDKLHLNICRKRKLASVGTHDLDKIQGKKFIYQAQKPQDIKFIPLKIDKGTEAKEMNSQQILDMYQQHIQLKEYVPLIYNSPVHPVIRDEKGHVLSLPPIINSDYSKISENTKNIFIEVTAQDLNRANIVLNQLIANFSTYCKFEVEPVKVILPNKNSILYPILDHTYFETTLKKVNSMGNFQISKEQCHDYLKQMMLVPVESNDNDKIGVNVPVTRSDILQECDILEDICIAYGYNKIKLEIPSSFTLGSQIYLNKMTNLIRQQLSQAGFNENLNFILCNPKDLKVNLNGYRGFSKDQEIVELENAKYAEYSVVRTTLVPGLLKWLSNNKSSKIPMKLFEVGDICVKDSNQDSGAKNIRHLAALYTNQESDFEIIHGLLDFIMAKLGFQWGNGKNNTYKLEDSDSKLFFSGLGANIIFNEKVVGVTGVLDPVVGDRFEWKYPVSLFELNLQILVDSFN